MAALIGQSGCKFDVSVDKSGIKLSSQAPAPGTAIPPPATIKVEPLNSGSLCPAVSSIARAATSLTGNERFGVGVSFTRTVVRGPDGHSLPQTKPDLVLNGRGQSGLD